METNLTRLVLVASAAVALSSAACSGDDAPRGGGAATEACNQACMCGNADACDGDCPIAAARWRQEGRDYYVACACSAGDGGGCTLEPRDIDVTFREACIARHGECMGTFHDDTCGYSFLYPDAAVADAMACLSQACDQVGACLATSFEG